MASIFDELLKKPILDPSMFPAVAPSPTPQPGPPPDRPPDPFMALITRLLTPAANRSAGNSVAGLGALLQTLRGGAHYGMSGALVDPATGRDPGNDAVFGGPIRFQSAPERLAEMTNRTGAYAPINPGLAARQRVVNASGQYLPVGAPPAEVQPRPQLDLQAFLKRPFNRPLKVDNQIFKLPTELQSYLGT